MTDEEYLRLEERVRCSWGTVPLPTSDPFLRRAIESFHPSGYTREKTIQELAEVRDGRELPFLLLRVNDWVPEVRDAARSAVLDRITAAYAPHFVRHLQLVMRLERAVRADHAQTLRAIGQTLTRCLSRDALIAALNTQDRPTGRAAFRMLVAIDGDLARAALRADDAAIRLAAMRMVPPGQRRGAYESLLQDPAGAVRAEALMAIGDRARLLEALFDRNANVRDVARFRLRGENFDFAALYRDALNDARVLVAIAGLAETGDESDAELLAPFLAHERAAVRRRAIRAVMKLAGDRYAGRAAALLQDASRSVSAQARNSLAQHASALGAAALWSLFERASLPHVRRNVLLLMRGLPKWDSIAFFLHATRDEDEDLAMLARELVARWNDLFNRGSAVPAHHQLDAIATALAHAKIDQGASTQIAFTLRTFR